jgi:protein-tyrosine phosphatase
MKAQLEKNQIIRLSGTDNTRDLGGLRTQDHQLIRCRRLIRSDHLNRLTPKDCAILENKYQVQTIVDLRRISEVSRQPDVKFHKAQILNIPLVPELQKRAAFSDLHNVGDLMIQSVHYMNDDVLAYQSKRYAEAALSDFTSAAVQKWIKVLLETENGAVLWHCTAGKDRTGALTALILLILGVDLKVVKSEYLLTNQIITKKIQWIVDKTKLCTSDQHILEQVRLLCSVHPRYFDSMMSAISSHYGHFSQYVRDHLHISEEMIKTLKSKYLISGR